jgi:cytochrome c oxidase subunit 2
MFPSISPFSTSLIQGGQPHPWQMTFQEAASPVMEGITTMHSLLMVIAACIATLVSVLLLYIMVRFRASKNPIPSKTSHHVLLEVVWTLVPVVILVVIGIPSMKLLFELDKPQNPDLTIKAVGHQWYWSYEYPSQDEKSFSFDSYMIEDKDLKPGQPRLLEVDNRVVVPVNATVRVLVTSTDVLHSFAVPSLGIKRDAVPGRVNETWFRIGREGVYYGQCSELCGVKHGFMPIAIEVVSKEAYETWLSKKRGA